MDVLAATGLINHFGKIQENDNISVSPILLRKGSTKLALYGMANVRDERLFRSFRQHQVKFFKPRQSGDEWFNLMAVHQNHVAHSSTGYLPENFLPDFMDLVVWGHEHDCIGDAIKNPDTGFSVLQPGSSVATSLIEGEAIPKFVFILSVSGKKYSLEKIRLMTVRPFAIASVSLATESGINASASNRTEITNWLNDKVEELIEEANTEWRSRPGNDNATSDPPLPLIRLKVDYSGGYDVENPRRFSNRFVQRVANVNDVVTFHRRRGGAGGSSKSSGSVRPTPQLDVGLDKIQVQSLVGEFLKGDDLQLLSENGLSDAIRMFVEKDDRDSLKTFVNESLQMQLDSLMKIENLDEESIPTEIFKAKKRMARQPFTARVERRSNVLQEDGVENEEDDILEDNMDVDTQPAARGRKTTASTKKPTPTAPRGGRGKKTATVVSKTTARGRKTNPSESAEDSDEDEDFSWDEGEQTRSIGRRQTSKTTRTSRSTARSSTTQKRKSTAAKSSGVSRKKNDQDNEEDDSDFEITQSPAPVRARASRATAATNRNRVARPSSSITAKRKREVAPSQGTGTNPQEALLLDDDDDDGFS